MYSECRIKDTDYIEKRDCEYLQDVPQEMLTRDFHFLLVQ